MPHHTSSYASKFMQEFDVDQLGWMFHLSGFAVTA
jgi:hypothetical protein